jgi:hypothetical protein
MEEFLEQISDNTDGNVTITDVKLDESELKAIKESLEEEELCDCERVIEHMDKWRKEHQDVYKN